MVLCIKCFFGVMALDLPRRATRRHASSPSTRLAGWSSGEAMHSAHGKSAWLGPPTPLAQSLSPSELRNPRSSPQASRAIDPTDRCGRRDVFQGRPGMCGVARGRGPLGWNGFRVGWNESGREENRQFTSHQPTTLQTTIGPASSNFPVSDAR